MTTYHGSITSNFVRGVDQPASTDRWSVAKTVFEQTGLSPKFHTNGENYKMYPSFKNQHFNVARILLNRGFNKRSPQTIVQEIVESQAIQLFWNQGLRDFILLNEVNLVYEHLGKLWDNATEFGNSYQAISQMLINEFPGLRLWTCGFSPGGTGSTPPALKPLHAFINEAKQVDAFKYCYGWTEHVYTGIVDNVSAAVNNMIAEVQDFQQQHALDKPLIIGEFSVNRPASPEYKASVYKAFYAALEHIPGVQAAYSFSSSWYDSPDVNQEGWFEHNIHTAYVN